MRKISYLTGQLLYKGYASIGGLRDKDSASNRCSCEGSTAPEIEPLNIIREENTVDS